MTLELDSFLSGLQQSREPECWIRKAPSEGDHIRVRRLGGLYYHHGIYVSDGEVIAFAGDDDYNPIDWWDTEIRATSLAEFRQGGIVEVRQYTPDEARQLCSVRETVAFARACLGKGKFNLLFHNCEHFASACKTGIGRSRQTEDFLLGRDIPKALACLGGKEQREEWLQKAWADLKAQVLDKLRRDEEARKKNHTETAEL